MSDGELVRRVVAGDTAAYGTLARRWFYRILAFCQSRLVTHDIHAAEDLAQEVLIRGFSDLRTLVDPDHFGAWLRGVARHVCSDWGRRYVREPEQDESGTWSHESSTAIPVDIAAANDERRVVLEQLSTIPEELREVVLLHYYETLTYDEMARWLGVSRATVNERLAKARALLRVRLAMLRSNV